MSALFVKVLEIKEEAIDIISIRMGSLDGSPLPAFTPGAHIDVYLNEGLLRQYSIFNSPQDKDYLVAVKKEAQSRGGSAYIHNNLKAGDTIKIGIPRNNFPLVEHATHSCFLAAGIGITPVFSMLNCLKENKRSYELHYFTRSCEHTAFYNTLSQPEYEPDVTFKPALDPVSLESYLVNIIGQHKEGTHLYLCGPQPFMQMVREISDESWPGDAVHMEYFSAQSELFSDRDNHFQVKLARSGGLYTVPADKSIVQVLMENGIIIPTSCEQGVCGTCVVEVLSGNPIHKDCYLLDDEKAAGDRICACVSRCADDILVLDI